MRLQTEAADAAADLSLVTLPLRGDRRGNFFLAPGTAVSADTAVSAGTGTAVSAAGAASLLRPGAARLVEPEVFAFTLPQVFA